MACASRAAPPALVAEGLREDEWRNGLDAGGRRAIKRKLQEGGSTKDVMKKVQRMLRQHAAAHRALEGAAGGAAQCGATSALPSAAPSAGPPPAPTSRACTAASLRQSSDELILWTLQPGRQSVCVLYNGACALLVRVCVAATIHTPRPDMSQQPGEWRGPWHGPVSSPVQRPVHPLHTARTLPERLAHDPHTVHTARTPARPRLALRRALSSQVDTGHQASFPSTAGGSRLHHLRHAPLDPAPGVRLKVSLSELHAKTVLKPPAV